MWIKYCSEIRLVMLKIVPEASHMYITLEKKDQYSEGKPKANAAFGTILIIS
jgi:hypothetical protein